MDIISPNEGLKKLPFIPRGLALNLSYQDTSFASSQLIQPL